MEKILLLLLWGKRKDGHQILGIVQCKCCKFPCSCRFGGNCDTWLWTRVQTWWEVGPGWLQRVGPLLAPQAEPRKMEKSRVGSKWAAILKAGLRRGIQTRNLGCQARALKRVQEGGGKRQSGKLPSALPLGDF